MKKIVALTGNSLLMQGLVSRLREYAQAFDLYVIELATPDTLQQVSGFQPDVIIFEEGDLDNAKHPSLVDFLNSFPDVVVIKLRLDDPSVQLIQSVRSNAYTADDLVHFFETSEGISDSANFEYGASPSE